MQDSLIETKKPEVKLWSGIPTLDSLIGGFEGGELIVLSGVAKSGKTLLFQTLTQNFASDGIGTLWLSYELTPYQFLRRFNQLPDSYMPALMQTSLPWVEDRIWEAKLKNGIKAVFIDHLHYLVDIARIRHPSLEIGSILRSLKSIAIRHNIVVFLICHSGKVRKGEIPTGEDIRDSSFVLQEPDTILVLWRVHDNPEKGIVGEARLSVELTRRTGVISRTVNLKKVKDHLCELVKGPEEEEWYQDKH
jgi:replicative DNA helicase